MVRTRFEWSILILIVALLGAAWIIESRKPPIRSENVLLTEAPLVGYLAPDFTAVTPAGVSHSLSDYVDRTGEAGQAQAVVLNFWASWCGPCRLEMPYFERVSRAYAGRAVVLGVNQAESAAVIEQFQSVTGVTYPLLVDDRWVVNNLYGAVNLPTTVFIDARGVVREVFVGAMSQAALEEKLKRILEDG